MLFDLPTYSKEIEEYLLSFNKPLLCFLSHGPCGIADGKKWQERVGLKVYLHIADKDSEWLRMKPDVLYEEFPNVSDGLSLIFTPGHTPGSVCLLEKETKSLFTGDYTVPIFSDSMLRSKNYGSHTTSAAPAGL